MLKKLYDIIGDDADIYIARSRNDQVVTDFKSGLETLFKICFKNF